jgi:hypothetical protein
MLGKADEHVYAHIYTYDTKGVANLTFSNNTVLPNGQRIRAEHVKWSRTVCGPKENDEAVAET